MRTEHKNVFFKVAQQFTCWIGLREPNYLTERWVGKPGYKPKPVTCKAKTADNSSHRWGGLVVDPNTNPGAFKPETLNLAKESWKKFNAGGRLPANYTSAESGNDKGLVKYYGSAIHADYDLMTIVKSNAQGEFEFTSKSELNQLFASVEPALNRGFGSRMIQHGAEFMWDEGVGARESEYVLWFGPGHRDKRSPSSMPKGGH